jgi:hypothetical protein
MKKIEILLSTFIVILLLSACNQEKKTIQGEIKELGNDTILVEYVALSKIFEIVKPNFDTIYSSNDKFSYNPIFSEPTLFF